ncbi:unnamed protein product [Malus baccata var. baccata]
MVVSTEVTHPDLIQGIYKRLRVSPSEFRISVHYQCISNLGIQNMMEIVDNDDVTSWVCESLSAKPNKIPLYVATYPLNEPEDEHPIACGTPSPTVAIQENDDILGDEQPSQVLQDNAQISEASIDVSFEFTDDYHDNTHFDNVQSNDVNFNLSSSRCNKRKSIQDYDNIADLNIDGDIMRDHRQVSSSVVDQFTKSKYEGASCVYRPKDIIENMRAQVGVNMSYEKAWRAREHAFDMIRRSPKESFAALPAYCAMLESKNPGTITHIETDDNNHFLYFFMAMGDSIRGFCCSMRPVVVVDRTFLKGKYLGTLFVAVCHDGQNQIYPLAFGVGDSENDASWTWFLTKLRSVIGEVTDLVFVSDRHGSIGKAVQTVFLEAYHGACMYHVAGNMRNTFGDDETMFKLYYTATKAYLVSEFNNVMTDI